MNESTGKLFDRVNSMRNRNHKSKYIKEDQVKSEQKIEDLFTQRHIHEVTSNLFNQINYKNEIENLN